MKSVRSIYILIAVIWFLAIGLAEAQSDVTYLGEFCVENITLFGPPITMFKVGVLKYGDNHLALSGKWVSGIQSPIYGSAIGDGENIIATLTTSQASDTNASYTVLSLTVNSTTMSGTMNTMTMTFLPTPYQQPVGQADIHVLPCNP